MLTAVSSYPHMKEDAAKNHVTNLMKKGENYMGEEVVDQKAAIATIRGLMSNSPGFAVK